MILFELARGSDLHAVLTLRDNGAAVDLTGMTPIIVEVLPEALATSMSFVISDGPGGQMVLSCPWSSAWPRGAGAVVQARVRLDGLHDAFPAIQVTLT